jgi:acetylornithine aminotransferase
VRGRDVWVWDSHGRRYLDCVAGIAVNTLGHSDGSLRHALARQLGKLQHVSNLYRIPEQEQLAALIAARSCFDRVFFCNSGAEANEAAIKLARKHGHRGWRHRAAVDPHGPGQFPRPHPGGRHRHRANPNTTRALSPWCRAFAISPTTTSPPLKPCCTACEAEGPRVAAGAA